MKGRTEALSRGMENWKLLRSVLADEQQQD